MSAEVELKIFLEENYSKTRLIEICRRLELPVSRNLSSLLQMSKEDLSTEIVTTTPLDRVREIFDAFPLSPEKTFVGRYFTTRRGRVSLEDGYRRLKLSLSKLGGKHPRWLRKTLKTLLKYGGRIDSENVEEEFPRKKDDVLDLLEELTREGVLEYRYRGKRLVVYEVPEERKTLIAEYLGIKKPKPPIEEPVKPPTPPVKSDLVEEEAYIAESEAELDKYIEGLTRRGETLRDFGEKMSLDALIEYLKNLLGEGLHFDGLLTLTQQLSLSETPIVGERGESGLKTGFNLALFGDPGTGKSFSTRDLLFGSKKLGIPPHGIPGINRYVGGMTAARFIRIGQAYEGKTFNFIVPEFNDWFRYSGMVEPLKLAMEGGIIKYEMHREVIGPYRLSSYFVVNYNTRIGEKGYETTVKDPNFSAIEDRMLCRLHRMTKERYVEIAKNQMRLLSGRVKGLGKAARIRDLLTAIYAIQRRRGEFGGRRKAKKILIDEENIEVFSAVRDAVIEAIPGKRLRFSARVERNALIFASSLSLVNYFRSEELIPLDKKALSLAIKFYVEEASIREGEKFKPEDVLRKLQSSV